MYPQVGQQSNRGRYSSGERIRLPRVATDTLTEHIRAMGSGHSNRRFAEAIVLAFSIAVLVIGAVIIIHRLAILAASLEKPPSRGSSTRAPSIPLSKTAPDSKALVKKNDSEPLGWIKTQLESEAGISYSSLETITATTNQSKSIRTVTGFSNWGYRITNAEGCQLSWSLTHSEQGEEPAVPIARDATNSVDLAELRGRTLKVEPFNWQKWTQVGTTTNDYGDKGKVDVRRIVTPASQTYWKLEILPNAVDPTNFIFDDREKAQQVASALKRAIGNCGGS